MPSRERPTSRRIVWQVATFTTLTIFALAALNLWPTANPQTLFQQSLSDRNPATQISLLQQAIAASNGGFPEAESRLCLLLSKDKRWDQVERLLAHSDIALWPDDERMAFAETCVQTSQGRFLEHLAAVMPDDARHWWQLARIHEQYENTMAAIRTYEAALKQNIPESEQIAMRHQLVDHSIDVGDLKRARELLLFLISQGERGPQIDVYRARIFHLEGQPAKALDPLNSALRELGDLPDGLRLRGILYTEMGQLDSAIKDFRRVIELAPHDEIAYFKLAEAYRRLGHRDGSKAMLKLAQTTHDAYLRHHQRKLRWTALVNQLKQSPNDEELRFKLEKLRAEFARDTSLDSQ